MEIALLAGYVAVGIVGMLVGILVTVLVYGSRGATVARGHLRSKSGKRIPEEWGEPLVEPTMRGW